MRWIFFFAIAISACATLAPAGAQDSSNQQACPSGSNLIVVRHAEKELDSDDPPLSTCGRSQATLLGERLAHRVSCSFSAVHYAEPNKRRKKDTADLAAEALAGANSLETLESSPLPEDQLHQPNWPVADFNILLVLSSSQICKSGKRTGVLYELVNGEPEDRQAVDNLCPPWTNSGPYGDVFWLNRAPGDQEWRLFKNSFPGASDEPLTFRDGEGCRNSG